LFTGRDLQFLEIGAGGMDRTEEDRITEAEKNERISQQLKVYICLDLRGRSFSWREKNLSFTAKANESNAIKLRKRSN